jgi:ubiquinone/menaquinone biosynthesis C-methylase UbiE
MEDPHVAETRRLHDLYAGYDKNRPSKWNRLNAGNRLIIAERIRMTEWALRSAGVWPLTDKKILEVGCGDGAVLADFISLGAAEDFLFGIDLVEERIEIARSRLPRGHLEVGDATSLQFPDASFDIVALFTVVSSIQSAATRDKLAREVARVTDPGGSILVYDLRVWSPTNWNVRPVRRRAVYKLFPGMSATARSLTVVPQLTRILGSSASRCYPILSAIPFMRTHNMIVLKRRI